MPASPNFGTIAAIFAIVVCFAATPFCIWKAKKWPDIGDTLVLALAAAGVISGGKITYLTVMMSSQELGLLADDKPALVVGGLATLSLSLREMVTKWRIVSGFA